MKPAVLLTLTALTIALGANPASAVTTAPPNSQAWDSEPDAWARGNAADASYFGWDVFEANNQFLNAGQVLDDTTPDLGLGTTAGVTRIFQNAGTTYGHRSGSGNYYSGFGPFDTADDTIEAVAPASGEGGFTTVVLQVLGGPDNAVEDLQFAMQTDGWSQQKNLYGTLLTGAGVYWQEWTAPGANLPFEIRMTSAQSSRSLDAIQLDTFWTQGDAPVTNARDVIGIPEPTSVALAGLTALAVGLLRRR